MSRSLLGHAISSSTLAPDIVVDGGYTGPQGAAESGVKTYRTVAGALQDAPSDSPRPYVILIKNGRYYEKLTIAKPFITLIGENRDNTILTFDVASGTKKPDGTTYGTWSSASVTVSASDFAAENLTIENGFDYPGNLVKAADDPTKLADPQAVALRTKHGSDKAIFKNIKFVGYQDTLFADSGRHYFKNCYIAGHIDFIFGAGQAVFDDCDIVSRDRGSATDNGYITAASTQIYNPYGFLFINCRLTKETPAMADGSVALGRPWHPTTNWSDGTRSADPNAVGCVVFKNCHMEAHISTKGWNPMAGKDKDGNKIWFQPQDARFYEYGSTGPGALGSDTRRVLSDSEARNYTLATVLGGWEPT
jgi:pectinesterase